MYLRPESVEVAVALIPRWAVSPLLATSLLHLHQLFFVVEVRRY
jgi:hypothetical protein